MTINSEPYLNTKDIFMPTPRAYKFIPTASPHFIDSLDKMINENTIWLSKVVDFNDPLEMASFTKDSDIDVAVHHILSGFFELIMQDGYLDKILNQQEKMPDLLKNKNLNRRDLEQFLISLKDTTLEKENPIEHFLQLAQDSEINLYQIIYDSCNNARNHPIDNAYVYCLSGNISNSAMWAYYGDQHRGIAVEFYKMSTLAAHAQTVSYTDRTPIISVKSDNLDT